MIKFLIQTIDGEIVHDFAFYLIEAIKYNNWYYNEKKYEYQKADNILQHDFSEYIPVGSIEFVLDFYKSYHGIDNIKPVNIPKELWIPEFLGRTIVSTLEPEHINADLNKEFFIKSVDKFKYITDIVKFKDIPPDENFLVSDIIDILSEWRGFVYKGKLLDIRNYSDDFKVFPDINTVEKMIEAYSNSPMAYTIDVAIDGNNKTVLIEVHQFFSCGLYGFNDYSMLPKMFTATHRDILSLKDAR